ncbi:MAG: hypothetical protein K2M73_01905 [Lachnospiraceae bacterium]|nr:hypothetical protein [Lachnospiraceae bacterium]
MRNINRNVSMICPLCGNYQFSAIDCDLDNLSETSDETRIKCSDCGRIVTKAVLIEENQERINANIEDVKKEVVNEIKKELKKMFRKLR